MTSALPSPGVASAVSAPALQTHDLGSVLVDMAILQSGLDEAETAFWIYDVDRKRQVWANKSALRLWDAETLAELQQRDFSVDMSSAVEQRLNQYKTDFERGNTRFSEIWTLYPKGLPRTLRVVYSGVRLKDGRMAILCEGAVDHDIQPENLRSAEALLHTQVMISMFDHDGIPLYRNPAARAACTDLSTTLFGQFEDQEDARCLLSLLKTAHDARLVARMVTSLGIRWHEVTVRECLDAATGVPAYLVSEIDVTELHETKERAEYLATHDTLTSLPNRAYLHTHLPAMISEAERQGYKAHVFLVDLDGFKHINDTMGHAAGDRLLQVVSAQFRDLLNKDDIVARLGGDEFLVCRLDKERKENPVDFGKYLLSKFKSPRDVDGQKRKINFSIGVASFPDHGKDMDTLLRHADLALYEAKAGEKNICVPFVVRMRHKLDQAKALKYELEQALERKDFTIYFQPRVCARSGEVVSAEALMRWHHPERGEIEPKHFIPVAENSGLINRLGEWVYREVASHQIEFAQQGLDLSLSINVSPLQFRDPTILGKILELPEKTGCDPTKIAFEITESVLLGEKSDVRQAVEGLKSAGYKIMVDDFGTGYSNLQYLQDYPIDAIKIDRKLLRNIDATGSIVRLILTLASVLKIRSVAEGVEKTEQLEWLLQNKCNEFQGFLFSEPLPKTKFFAAAQAGHQKLLVNLPPELRAAMG
ncbi:diguanylate cyclase/phosphodiesterase [Roseibium hamelinense]|uniref:Diguanylate cyclase/phosphodiesterase n=1 Tax=Roseibium hamelinense TaxID=150831 RepID=A0A562T1M7_9HYPH|nr:EAL domain-containing protein [Roseibium hamelinense]MTI44494.1 EAL domain-containing protein [Roseibium hamelinense]TWI87462.1 diguanylate cyclase/phosphodiesterase [Roseibium hamelinense]